MNPFNPVDTFAGAAPPADRPDDVVSRLALIKPPGSGDSGMAEERG